MENQSDVQEYSIVVKECPICGGKWKFYDGLLGYESLKCIKCGFDINDIKIVSEEVK